MNRGGLADPSDFVCLWIIFWFMKFCKGLSENLQKIVEQKVPKCLLYHHVFEFVILDKHSRMITNSLTNIHYVSSFPPSEIFKSNKNRRFMSIKNQSFLNFIRELTLLSQQSFYKWNWFGIKLFIKHCSRIIFPYAIIWR